MCTRFSASLPRTTQRSNLRQTGTIQLSDSSPEKKITTCAMSNNHVATLKVTQATIRSETRVTQATIGSEIRDRSVAPQSLFQCEGFSVTQRGLALSRPSPIVYQCASTVVSISDLGFRPARVPGLGLYNETGKQEAWYTQTILRFLFRHARCACVCAIFQAAATLQCSGRNTRVSL